MTAAADDLTATSIEAAAALLAPVLKRTPLEPSERLSARLGVPVLLKREDIQVCRSYKARGAFNLISSLSEAERARGVVCASAGNHGQGLAFACRELRIRGRVFLPTNTPRQKRERIADIGGEWIELVIAGSSYDEASAAAHADSAQTGAIYVHPFDDARTIAGQGTVALELAEQAGEQGAAIDTVVVPVGGGGLIAGIALWLKRHHPAIHVVGAEPAGAASMGAALAAGGPVSLARVDTFVDGAAVGRVGEQTYPLVRDLVDEVVAVPEGAVCTEMLELYQSEGVIAEPAGALASAAAKSFLRRPPQGPVACVVSGGNNDVSRYGDVLERSMVHEGLRHYFLVTFPQEPGALRHFLDEVLAQGEDIVVFEYVKKNNRETGPALVGIELERALDLPALLQRMEQSPLQIEQVPPGSPIFTFLL
ncbi:threonine ammonia-lyase IlvA [Conexibacter stalactiti]|uniref:L-threonine dehydratase n=1 Tax=Conexibacter stalactiti TaxID=1940611 RepID=A0ABU4HSA8_9ACTN|nr:threonine ammonia-lyase IlvA [Conexibacter stalactiti]MDW5596200.1 threonine ammonia-lyase IlvA [Conexibacter stalactiti]MEC5036842.1 threonine ammonia-lyase IlvA [Conexibacter stalactiti]